MATLIVDAKYQNTHNTQNKMDKTAINHQGCKPGHTMCKIHLTIIIYASELSLKFT